MGSRVGGSYAGQATSAGADGLYVKRKRRPPVGNAKAGFKWQVEAATGGSETARDQREAR